MEWLMLGGVGTAFDVFSYNRKNFMFDGKMQLEREYQGQSMNIAQFGLYREDVRDVVNLTVDKMDTYLVVNTILLLVAFVLFTEGKPRPDLGWKLRTIWLYTLCNVGAILYFLLSAWLAMHASIVAHSFGVRMLTQFARLPVPTTAELDAARAQALDYESKGAGELLRIPVVQANEARDPQTAREAQMPINRLATELERDVVPGSQSLRDEAAAPLPQEANAITSLEHVQLFRELQSNWIGYDAYARVCMMMGINQFCHAFGYYCIGVFIMENHQPFVGLGVALALLVASWFILKLDIYVSSNELIMAAVIFLLAPILEVVSLTITIMDHSKEMETLSLILMPVIFFIHIIWIACIIRLAWAEDVSGVALPKAFRAVTYLDVYSWISAPPPPETTSSRVSPILSPRADPMESPSFVLDPVSEATEEGDEELPHYQEAVDRELGHLRLGQVRPALGNPTEIRLALLGECQKFSERLSHDIGRWENQVVMEMLTADARNQVTAARKRFTTVKNSLADLEIQSNEEMGGASTEEYSKRVWLHVGSIYYNPDTGQSDFECPQEAHRISDIGTLEEEINEWAKHVRALRDSPSEPNADTFVSRTQPPSRHHSDASSSSNFPHFTTRSRTSDGRRDTADELSSASSHTSVTAGIRQFEPHQEGNFSDPSRFAGLESVQLTRFTELRGRFMDSCTFMLPRPHVHPNRRLRVTPTGESRRPPGEVPFRTFCQGSIVLLLVWTIGLVWNTFDAFNIDIPLVYPNTTHNGTEQHGAFAGPWPHPFFKSSGLACHKDAPSRVYVAERYAVHELDVRSEPIQFRPALVGCLEASPEFQAAGIDDITIQCDLLDVGSSGCYAFLLSVGYSAVLRCPLDSASGGAIILLPRGYSWLALTSGLHSKSFWALTSKGIVELGLRQHDAIEELVPLSIARLSLDATKLHVLFGTDVANSSLLTMDDSGSMLAWPLHNMESLPIELTQESLQDTRWVGLCSTVEDVFIVSESRYGHRTNLWRRSLKDLLATE